MNPAALFEDAVSRCFAFLEAQYGCTRSLFRPTGQAVVVYYESASFFLRLILGPPTFEPEMAFGRPGIDDGQDGFSFGPGDLMWLRDGQSQARPDQIATYAIEAQLAWFASLLRDRHPACLAGDLAIYAEMTSRRGTEVAKWRRAQRDGERSRQIEAAWKVRDYHAVIALCSGHEVVLGRLDRKRLAFARTKCRGEADAGAGRNT